MCLRACVGGAVAECPCSVASVSVSKSPCLHVSVSLTDHRLSFWRLSGA